MAIDQPPRGISKKEILKGVYEDNLKTRSGTFGSDSRVRVVFRERPIIGRTVAIAVFVLLAFISVALFVPFRNAKTSVAAQILSSFGEEPIQYRYEGLGGASLPLANLPQRQDSTRGTSNLPLASLFDLQVHTIVIDPGHGGIDGGTVGQFGTKESDITLDVARRLQRRLEKSHGFRVLLTRNGDHRVDLRQRVEFANERRADLFVSIHVNYLPQEPVTLIETYYFDAQGDRGALSLAEQENKGSQYTMADFNEMLQKIGTTLRMQESKRMAESIQTSLMRNMRQTNHRMIDAGVKTAPFVVLLGVEAPSVLAEIACLNNRVEEIKLNTPLYRDRLAAALEDGIVAYLRQHPNETIQRSNSYAVKED